MQAAWALMEQAHLVDETAEAERRLGVAVQSVMLPEAVPDAVQDKVSVAVRYRPASQALTVGGDWYDVMDIGDGRVAVAVGDVVGHGMVAASVMGQLRSALFALVSHPEQYMAPLDDVVTAVTQRLHDSISSPWGGAALLGVGALLLLYFPSGRLSSVTSGAAWALLVLAALAAAFHAAFEDATRPFHVIN